VRTIQPPPRSERCAQGAGTPRRTFLVGSRTAPAQTPLRAGAVYHGDVETTSPTVAEVPPPGSAADRTMRRLLRVPDQRTTTSDAETHRIFGVSILLSATRCLLSYIVFPIVLPFLGLARGVGPWIGIPVGLLALTFDALGIRRFWMADHRQKWLFTAIYAVVGTMVAVLVAIDVVHLLG